MQKTSNFDVIIPTKNRPDDFNRLIVSITTQSILPNRLIVIDQSDKPYEKSILLDAFPKNSQSVVVKHIVNQDIRSLVEAKSVGLKYASATYVFFLDDDVVLKPGYFSNILRTFKNDDSLMGCSGFIDNAVSNRLWLFVFEFFHKGIFSDARPSIFSQKVSHEKVIRCSKIPQGVSAWRSEVFRDISFDPKLKFHMVEDLHFSISVEKLYPNSQAIVTDSFASHFHATSGRDHFQKRFRRKLFEFTDLWRMHRDIPSTFAFALLMLGFAFEAVYYCIKFRNLETIKSFIEFVFHTITLRGMGKR